MPNLAQETSGTSQVHNCCARRKKKLFLARGFVFHSLYTRYLFVSRKIINEKERKKKHQTSPHTPKVQFIENDFFWAELKFVERSGSYINMVLHVAINAMHSLCHMLPFEVFIAWIIAQFLTSLKLASVTEKKWFFTKFWACWTFTSCSYNSYNFIDLLHHF